MGASISVTSLVYSAAVFKIILLCQSIKIKSASVIKNFCVGKNNVFRVNSVDDLNRDAAIAVN